MMRDNNKRLSAGADPAPAVADDAKPSLDFATPTELVDLPSKGKFYSEGHPLYNQETIEIKYMTARDEDILTSPSLLKKGLAIDRFLQNVIRNQRINVGSLLTGDKSAIIVASRINGFGAEYKTKVTCPNCITVSEYTFDLDGVEHYYGDDLENYDVVPSDRGTFIVKLPRTKFEVEVRLLTGRDENELAAKMQSSQKRSNKIETNLTDQLKKVIVSVNGVEDIQSIHQVVNNLPAYDSRYLRGAYAKITPGLDMTQHFGCPACGFEKEVDIPLTVDFFWSKQ
jgi:hypothetical protein